MTLRLDLTVHTMVPISLHFNTDPTDRTNCFGLGRALASFPVQLFPLDEKSCCPVLTQTASNHPVCFKPFVTLPGGPTLWPKTTLRFGPFLL